MRRLLVFLAVLVVVLGLGPPAHASSLAMTPADCVVQPGRFTVTPGASHVIVLATVAVKCTKAYDIQVKVRSLRYWVSTKTWTVERTGHALLSTGGLAPAYNYPFACNVAGALMWDTITYKYSLGGVLVGRTVYHGFNKALCPS
jgi:hypothetical protein